MYSLCRGSWTLIRSFWKATRNCGSSRPSQNPNHDDRKHIPHLFRCKPSHHRYVCIMSIVHSSHELILTSKVLIVHRLWTVERDLNRQSQELTSVDTPQSLRDSQPQARSPLGKIMIIIIESGIMFTTTECFCMITFALESNLSYVATYMVRVTYVNQTNQPFTNQMTLLTGHSNHSHRIQLNRDSLTHGQRRLFRRASDTELGSSSS